MKTLFTITGKAMVSAIILTAMCTAMVFAESGKSNDIDLHPKNQIAELAVSTSAVEWMALDANTTVSVNGSQVVVSRLHPAGYNTGLQ